MKPFNLEQAIQGKPICDRKGRPCRFIAHDTAPHVKYPLICRDWASKLNGYRASGRATFGDDSDDDLFMAESVRREGWVGIYRDTVTGQPYTAGSVYLTKSEVQDTDGTLITAVHIEWME